LDGNAESGAFVSAHRTMADNAFCCGLPGYGDGGKDFFPSPPRIQPASLLYTFLTIHIIIKEEII